MENELVQRAANLTKSHPNRVLITIAGIPGAGKSTTAELVAAGLVKHGISAQVVGMDGFHYTRTELAKQIGEEKAVKFRGAPYTFDAPGVVSLAEKLAQPQAVSFPTFDHAVKDPVENGGYVAAETQVVLLEGLYVQLSDPVWREIGQYAHDTWFVDVAEDVARRRLAARHLKSGIVDTLEAGEARADSNDLPNGRYIKQHSVEANYTLNSSNF